VADESPELFHALAQIGDPKRRVGRLRDLATRGLVFTLSGFARTPDPRLTPRVAADSDTSTALPQGVIDALTDWKDD